MENKPSKGKKTKRELDGVWVRILIKDYLIEIRTAKYFLLMLLLQMAAQWLCLGCPSSSWERRGWRNICKAALKRILGNYQINSFRSPASPVVEKFWSWLRHNLAWTGSDFLGKDKCCCTWRSGRGPLGCKYSHLCNRFRTFIVSTSQVMYVWLNPGSFFNQSFMPVCTHSWIRRPCLESCIQNALIQVILAAPLYIYISTLLCDLYLGCFQVLVITYKMVHSTGLGYLQISLQSLNIECTECSCCQIVTPNETQKVRLLCQSVCPVE